MKDEYLNLSRLIYFSLCKLGVYKMYMYIEVTAQ